ncbi:MAG: nucleoside deaminase [Mycobacteriales bacterium]
MTPSDADRYFLHQAIAQARLGLAEGGIPIGAALVADGQVLGVGRNRRVQEGSAIRHAETDAVERAGRQAAEVYRRSTLYTTLSPCDLCTGLALLYGIPRVVIGENATFLGGEQLLRSRGVQVDVVDDPTCLALMTDFVRQRPELWYEDIGEVSGR